MNTLSETSKAFLRAAFGPEAGNVWVECGTFYIDKDGNEQFGARWKGRARKACPQPGEAVFFAVGIPEKEERKISCTPFVRVLVMDDVGSIHDKDMVDLFAPEASASTNSSDGNWQYAWFCSEKLTAEEHAALWKGMEALVGGKCHGSDIVHLFRAPEGVNAKTAAGKRMFPVRLTAGSFRTYTKAELLAAFRAPAAEKPRTEEEDGEAQQAPSVEAVRRLLFGPLKNRWDGSVNSNLRKGWMDILHAIKGGLQAWPEEAEVLGREWSGPHETDFDRAWESIRPPHRAGWGALEKRAKAVGAGEMAVSAFDDGMELLEPPDDGRIGMNDFWAHAPSGKFIYTRTGDMWPAESVNARIPPTMSGKKVIQASTIIRQIRQVQQISWVPGRATIVEDMVVNGGGLVPCVGNRIYNSYVGPAVEADGDPMKTLPWTAHAQRLYPDDWEWILDWFAHRVQFPGGKVNHALVLGGKQGIGKDTLLAPLVAAVGAHNFGEVKPQQLMERFNIYKKSVVLRVNEAHDLGEGQNRVKFYNMMKTLIAAPPETLQVEQKGLDVYSIPNVVGVIITTNYKLDGLYLPEDDRRHYVAWSNKTESDFGAAHFDRLWKWFSGGGYAHCRAFLRARDLSRFDPKLPPPKTRAFWSIARAGEGMAGGEVEDVILSMGGPAVFGWDEFINAAPGWAHDMAEKNPKALAARLDGAGYEKIENPANKHGRWRVGDRWAMIYARKDMSVGDQRMLAQKWAREKSEKDK